MGRMFGYAAEVLRLCVSLTLALPLESFYTRFMLFDMSRTENDNPAKVRIASRETRRVRKRL